MVDDLITFGEADITQSGLDMDFTWYHGGEPTLRILFEDTRQDGDALFSDITVWWLRDQPLGVRPIQPSTVLKINNSHFTGWRNVKKVLVEDFPTVDWNGAMTYAVYEVMEAYKRGNPSVRLGDEIDRLFEEPFILKPYISSSGATLLYGEGGLSKSLVALGLAISVSTGVPIFGNEPTKVGPVMYFDYEDDDSRHDARLMAMCRALGIPSKKTEVYHHSLTAKVTAAKREMKRRVEDKGAVMGVIDSVGMARGGSAVAAEDTIRLFRALKEVGVPFLAIDHVSKASKGEKGGAPDAYGSIYTMNSSRLAWHLQRQAIGGQDQDIISMLATNTKANHTRRQQNRIIEVRYDNDERGVPVRIHIETSDDFGLVRESISTHQRLMMQLGDGEWWTYDDVVEKLDIPRTTLRSVVSRDAQNEVPSFEQKKEYNKTWIRLSTALQQDATHDATLDETDGSEGESE